MFRKMTVFVRYDCRCKTNVGEQREGLLSSAHPLAFGRFAN